MWKCAFHCFRQLPACCVPVLLIMRSFLNLFLAVAAQIKMSQTWFLKHLSTSLLNFSTCACQGLFITKVSCVSVLWLRSRQTLKRVNNEPEGWKTKIWPTLTPSAKEKKKRKHKVSKVNWKIIGTRYKIETKRITRTHTFSGAGTPPCE